MKKIPLSGGTYEAIVDDADYARLSAYRWHAKVKRGGRVYAVRNNKRGLSPQVIKMHQEITGYAFVDHKNGDGLDNRRDNLRRATRSQNGANRRVVLNKHGYKGVSHHPYLQNKGKRWPRKKPWTAQITVERKVVRLGYFSTPEAAAEAYDQAAVRFFGEFAATNRELLEASA